MRTGLPDHELSRFLDESYLATLATLRHDGSVLLSPVWYEWQDDGFNVVIEADDIKSRQLQRDPRATVIVAEQRPPYRSVEVRGIATLARNAAVPALLRRIAVRYLGETEGNRYADGMAEFHGEWLRLTPGRLRSWDYADTELPEPV